MTKEEAVVLVRSLLERIDADVPTFAGLLSPTDRIAIGALLELTTGATSSPVQAQPPAPRQSSHVSLNTAGLKEAVDDTGTMLCLDFGTAKSKAFATCGDDHLPLGIGDLDGDRDRSVFGVASSVWIDDSGLLFVGAEAISRGEEKAIDGRRQRLDSLKQLISQASSLDMLTHTTLSLAENPTAYPVTPDDAVSIYLGYLTDLANTALDGRSSRYVRRRFSLPCWSKTHRSWSAPYMARLFGRAQLVADTFQGRWQQGIPVDECLAVLAAARKHDDDSLRWIATDDTRPEHQMPRWGGVLEPLAAGSASVWRPLGRELVLVLDVGAGTSDFSLFLVTQGQPQAPGHGAIPIAPIADAVRFAGDYIDDILLHQLLEKGRLDPGTTLGKQVQASVRLSGLRRIKERLFIEHRIDVPLTHDVVVSIEESEFLSSADIRNFETQLHSHVKTFLESTDPSVAPLLGTITLVLTGGGRDLPMVASLAQQSWAVHGATVDFHAAHRVPRAFQQYGDSFSREYPQLAVAIGGSLLKILDERNAIVEWTGGAPTPGPLDRVQTGGI